MRLLWQFLRLPFFVFLFLYGDVVSQRPNNAAQSGQCWGVQHSDMHGVTAARPQILAGGIYGHFIGLLDPQSQGPVLLNVSPIFSEPTQSASCKKDDI